MHNRSRLHLPAAVALAVGLCGAVLAGPPAEKDLWTPLFDGKSLAGWDGLRNHWRAEAGAIVGWTSKEDPIQNNTFLVWTNGTVGNFELHAKYRITPVNDNGFANSGIQYRSKLVDPVKFIVGGYQADMEAGQTYSGILYEERGRGILAERGQRTRVVTENGQTKVVKIAQIAPSAELQRNIRDREWNDYVIVAQGNHLMHFINHKLTADVVDDQPDKGASEGILALQLHAGPPMLVEFRDLLLKRLP
jgi:Domain of Unknown Function (DUF1080)